MSVSLRSTDMEPQCISATSNSSPPLAAVPEHSPPPVPPLSPSVSTSLDSSSLPSPEGEGSPSYPLHSLHTKSHGVAGNKSYPQPKDTPPSAPSFSHDSQPPRSRAWNRHVRARTLSAQQSMAKRIHPYDPRKTATPLELRFTTRALGHPSHIGMTLEDVGKV